MTVRCANVPALSDVLRALTDQGLVRLPNDRAAEARIDVVVKVSDPAAETPNGYVYPAEPESEKTWRVLREMFAECPTFLVQTASAETLRTTLRPGMTAGEVRFWMRAEGA